MNKHSFRIFTAAFFIFSAFFNTVLAQSEPQLFSLEQAIDYGLKHSISIEKSALDIANAEAQVKEYQAIGIPKLNAKIDYTNNVIRPTSFLPDFISPAVVGILEGFRLVPGGSAAQIPTGGVTPVQFGVNNNLTASITASTLVFDGSYLVGLKAAKGLRELVKRQANLTDFQVRYSIMKAYALVLVAEENKNVLSKNIENLKKLFTETKAFKEAGFVEQLDVDRLELSVSNLQSEQEIVQRQVDLAYNALKFMMGYDVLKPIALSNKLDDLLIIPTDAELNGNVPHDSRIEMEVLKRTEYLNELNVKRLQMGYYPNVTAFASFQEQLQRNNLFDKNATGFTKAAFVGATINIPIFDGFDKRSKIQRARIDQRRYQLEIENFKLAMNLEVTNSRAIYRNALQRLDNQNKNLVLAEKILVRTKIKYKEGVGSSIEITTAEQELYRTQANKMNALYELVAAKIDLDKALGK